MVADLSVRTQRRFDELVAKGIDTYFDEVRADIVGKRDREELNDYRAMR